MSLKTPHSRQKLFIPLVILLVVAGSLASKHIVSDSYAVTAANVTVDFGAPLRPVDPNAFSGTISTYGQSGGSIVASAKQRTALGALGPGLYRLPLSWNGGNIISAAGGGSTTISGDTWVSSIRSFGGVPQIVLGGSTDNNFTPQDGANMVSHFSGANKVDYWVIGNEPGNGGMSIATYCTLFNQTAAAMKAVDPTIKVAGPAWAYYDAATLQAFLGCAGSSVDIIDYHHYAMGGSFLDSATALSQTGNWETEVNQVRAMITATVPARAGQIGVQVGELNWSWQTADGYPGAYQGEDRFYQPVATVWSASVLGHILRAGGIAHTYADQNGALSVTFEKSADAAHFGRTVNDPMPIYYGWQMFSGGPFRRFGATVVQASTALANTEVFASASSDNIVLINKDPSLAQPAVISTAGVDSGTADIWQTNQAAPFAAPTMVGSAPISGSQLQVTLPPYSVTTLIVTPGGIPTPTPTPAPTQAPTSTPTPTPTVSPAHLAAGSTTPSPTPPATAPATPAPGAYTLDASQSDANPNLAPIQAASNQVATSFQAHPVITLTSIIAAVTLLGLGFHRLVHHFRPKTPVSSS